MRKRIFTSLLVAIAIIGMSIYPNNVVSATSRKPITQLTGYVFPPREDPYDVEGLLVQVDCLDYFTGKNYGSGEDRVAADGSYLVTIPMDQCPAGCRILGGAGDDDNLHYGHGRNYGDRTITSKLIIYEGDIGMLW